MSGTADEMKGRAKEAAGDLTDDDSLKAKGKADKASGKAKGLVDDMKDKAEDAVDKVKEKLDRN
jgi:uncharacterized protein YjbJ (UPF0337 family)